MIPDSLKLTSRQVDIIRKLLELSPEQTAALHDYAQTEPDTAPKSPVTASPGPSQTQPAPAPDAIARIEASLDKLIGVLTGGK